MEAARLEGGPPQASWPAAPGGGSKVLGGWPRPPRSRQGEGRVSRSGARARSPARSRGGGRAVAPSRHDGALRRQQTHSYVGHRELHPRQALLPVQGQPEEVRGRVLLPTFRPFHGAPDVGSSPTLGSRRSRGLPASDRPRGAAPATPPPRPSSSSSPASSPRRSSPTGIAPRTAPRASASPPRGLPRPRRKRAARRSIPFFFRAA